MISLASLTVFSTILTIVSNPVLIVLAALLNGLTIAVFGMVAAYIGDVTPAEEVDHRMSLNMLGQGAGFAIGPILGGFVSQSYGYHQVYYLCSGMALIALFVTFRSMRDSTTTLRARGGSRLITRGREVLSNPTIISVYALAVLMSCAFGCIYFFFPLRASSIGLSDTDIGVVLGVRTFMSTVVRYPSGRLSRWLGHTRILAVSLLLPATAGILIPFFGTVAALALIVSLEGVGYGIYLTISRIMVAMTVEPAKLGISMSLLDIFGAIGQIFLVLLLGFAAGVVGLGDIFFIMSAILVVGGTVPIYLLSKNEKSYQARVEFVIPSTK